MPSRSIQTMQQKKLRVYKLLAEDIIWVSLSSQKLCPTLVRGGQPQPSLSLEETILKCNLNDNLVSKPKLHAWKGVHVPVIELTFSQLITALSAAFPQILSPSALLVNPGQNPAPNKWCIPESKCMFCSFNQVPKINITCFTQSHVVLVQHNHITYLCNTNQLVRFFQSCNYCGVSLAMYFVTHSWIWPFCQIKQIKLLNSWQGIVTNSFNLFEVCKRMCMSCIDITPT